MVKRVTCIFLLLVLSISVFSFGETNQEVLLQSPVEKEALIEVEKAPFFSLWHYSGQYWKLFGEIIAYDSQLEAFKNDSEELALALEERAFKGEAFELTLAFDAASKEKINQIQGHVDVSLDITDELLAKDEKLTEYIYTTGEKKPTFTWAGDKIVLKFHPKFTFAGFFKDMSLRHSTKKALKDNYTYYPVVKENFGCNTYAIWDANSLGLSYSIENNYIYPDDSRIQWIDYSEINYNNGVTQLERAAQVPVIGADSRLDKYDAANVNIGKGSFENGGAVGIQFYYPLKVNVYAKSVIDFSIKNQGEDVSDNAQSPVQLVEGESLTVDLVNTSSFENVDTYEWLTLGDDNSWQVLDTFDDKSDLLGIEISSDVTNKTYKLIGYDASGQEIQASEHSVYIDKVSVISQVSSHFIIDYNELSKEFTYEFNDGYGVNIDSGSPPKDGTWTSDLTGDYQIYYEDKALLNDYAAANDRSVDTSTNSSRIYPRIDFTSKRQYFGENPVQGDYYKTTDTGVFRVKGEGSIDRDYKYTKTETKHVQKKDDDGNLMFDANGDPIMEKVNSSSTVNGTKTIQFNPQVDSQVEVTLLSYYGDSNDPLIYISTNEAYISQEDKRDFSWEGNHQPFFVSREMYDATGQVVEVPGQYIRSFQPDNTGSVAFKPLEFSFYDDYRNQSINVKGIYMNAPYTLTNAAEDEFNHSGRMTMKSGYFYEIGGVFEATVKTTAYVKGRSTYDYDDTGHGRLLNSVKDNFRIISNIPTVDHGKDHSIEYPEYYNHSGNVTVNMSHTTTSDVDKVPYNSYAYEKNMEENSSYKYDEIVSSLTSSELRALGIYGGAIDQINEDIYKVTEETTIIFEIPKQKKYVYIDTPDGDYTIGAFIDGFEVSDQDIHGTGELTLGELPKEMLTKDEAYFQRNYYYNFVVDGVMTEDINTFQ